MTLRILLIVAIRLIGLSTLLNAIINLTQFASYYGFSGSFQIPAAHLIRVGLQVLVQGLLGALLIRWAPWIAARLCPAGHADTEVHLNVGPGDLYHITCFVFGVYLLVRSSELVTRLVADAMSGAQSTWSRGQMIAHVVVAAVNVAAGIVLVFGAQWIGRLLASLRHDSDTIPQQQVGVAFLLLLVAAFAVILGVMRAVTHGGL
jgi:hypothetical protein